jgi:hypothetical protein
MTRFITGSLLTEIEVLLRNAGGDAIDVVFIPPSASLWLAPGSTARSFDALPCLGARAIPRCQGAYLGRGQNLFRTLADQHLIGVAGGFRERRIDVFEHKPPILANVDDEQIVRRVKFSKKPAKYAAIGSVANRPTSLSHGGASAGTITEREVTSRAEWLSRSIPASAAERARSIGFVRNRRVVKRLT